jgi:hypothetical protein
VEHRGTLPLSAEIAVADLIALAKQQQQEIAGLQRMNMEAAERIAAQSELLSRRAEAAVEQAAPLITPQAPSIKRGKG